MALLQLQRDKQVTVFLHEGEKVKYNLAFYKLFSHQDQNLLRDIFFSDCWCNVFFSVYVSSLQIVKFCQPGQDRVSPVSDVEIGIYQLQRSEKLLGERVEKLGLQADKYVNSNMNLSRSRTSID